MAALERVPQAFAYHTVSTGFAGLLGPVSLARVGAGLGRLFLAVGGRRARILDRLIRLVPEDEVVRRLRGEAYDALLEEFVEAVCEVFPGALLQWEDFRKDNASRLLDRYRDRLPSFNDDIQGTGAVCLAGIQAAMRRLGERLADQRFVIHGAGAAGLGIARQIRAALAESGGDGGAVLALDSRGLIVAGDKIADDYKAELAVPAERAAELGCGPGHHDLLSVVRGFRPTVLVGTSGQPGAFNREIVEAMATGCALVGSATPPVEEVIRDGEFTRENGIAVTADGVAIACGKESIEGDAGDFKVTLLRAPRYVDAEKCTGCKACIAACPYDARLIMHPQGYIDKCTFCHHRLEQGLGRLLAWHRRRG